VTRLAPTPGEPQEFAILNTILVGGPVNPGPHGPEPCRLHVLLSPTDSCGVRANTKSTSLVSFGDPIEPSDAGNA